MLGSMEVGRLLLKLYTALNQAIYGRAQNLYFCDLDVSCASKAFDNIVNRKLNLSNAVFYEKIMEKVKMLQKFLSIIQKSLLKQSWPEVVQENLLRKLVKLSR